VRVSSEVLPLHASISLYYSNESASHLMFKVKRGVISAITQISSRLARCSAFCPHEYARGAVGEEVASRSPQLLDSSCDSLSRIGKKRTLSCSFLCIILLSASALCWENHKPVSSTCHGLGLGKVRISTLTQSE
jgi:hypothetical protein